MRPHHIVFQIDQLPKIFPLGDSGVWLILKGLSIILCPSSILLNKTKQIFSTETIDIIDRKGIVAVYCWRAYFPIEISLWGSAKLNDNSWTSWSVYRDFVGSATEIALSYYRMEKSKSERRTFGLPGHKVKCQKSLYNWSECYGN